MSKIVSSSFRPLLIAVLVLSTFVVSHSSAASLFAQQAAVKIAVVDIDRVVVQSKKGQELQGRLKALEQETQAKLEEKAQKIQTLQESLAGKSLEETRLLQKQIEDETLSGRRIREDAQRTAEKMQQDELSAIRDSLRPVFEKIQAESAFDLILNYNPAIVLSASESVDITERVLTVLNGG
jgi:Skp family chaperone for outer membrane proteins